MADISDPQDVHRGFLMYERSKLGTWRTFPFQELFGSYPEHTHCARPRILFCRSKPSLFHYVLFIGPQGHNQVHSRTVTLGHIHTSLPVPYSHGSQDI
ncbi:hypothetical protein GDO81_027668 [Engystomops pustulosus]|uniref:Uncharacterized protein n=1 Tax=Engystomops pustulosus TaxID=76066 RepID=A0AAV6ZDY2_ENGPU|nr:hypothetical protein GDO81_027668 [Engystomops pustulosus]